MAAGFGFPMRQQCSREWPLHQRDSWDEDDMEQKSQQTHARHVEGVYYFEKSGSGSHLFLQHNPGPHNWFKLWCWDMWRNQAEREATLPQITTVSHTMQHAREASTSRQLTRVRYGTKGLNTKGWTHLYQVLSAYILERDQREHCANRNLES